MVQEGSTVKIHYAMMVDGNVVASSLGREPLSFVHGKGEVLPGLEEQVGRLNAGDKKRIEIPPEKAYGQVDPKAIVSVPKEAFAEPEKISAGANVQGDQDGRSFRAVVKEVREKDVLLDANHPLAGKTLTCDIEVLSVEKPKT